MARRLTVILVVLAALSIAAGSGASSTSRAGCTGRVAGDRQVAGALVHVPARLAGRPPVLVAFHGLRQAPGELAASTRLERTADRYGFVVAFPAAVDPPGGWELNAASGADDVGRTAALLDALAPSVCADPARTYLVGLSNGAGFAMRAACDLAGRVAAVVAVVGSYRAIGACPADGPRVALMEVHGSDPFAGSVPRLMAMWRARDRCGGAAVTVRPQRGVRVTRWTGCPVVRVRLAHTGHVWPGGTIPGEDRTGYDASTQAWAFVRGFRRCGTGLCRASAAPRHG